jgi:single-stranded-DNA-specific exonuclease
VTSPAPPLPLPPDPLWDEEAPPPAHEVARLAAELSLPESLCAVLAARGLSDPESARRYLRPRLEHLHPPENLPDAEVAVDRMLRAVEEGETIFVHGDYDVDGVAATATLTRWLRRLGGRVVPFVPHRTEHGYDLGPAGLEAAAAAGATLLVTCDSGILAHEAVERAGAMGIDVIVTDHHTPGETLPRALAVVNPARTDATYPERILCGTGVVYKLCQLLARRRGIEASELHPLLALVALATVADLVPLVGENRILVRFGLRFLEHTTDPGLVALKEVAGVEGIVDAGDVGFQLAPRINAVGRMGAARTALELLLTTDPAEARELASTLEEANRLRRAEDRRTLDEALALLAERYDPERDFGVVLAAEGWHPGVIGIVASRVVERIHRPVVMVALEAGRGRGSARSIPGVHLFEALSGCREHLVRFGGHRQAAGMDLDAGALDAFRAAFNAEVRAQLAGENPVPRLRAEVTLSVGAADEALWRYLEHMAPFGIGNPRPVFRARGAQVEGRARIVGDGHLKLRLRDPEPPAGALSGRQGPALEAIGFGLGHRRPPDALGSEPVDALFRLRTNEYRGTTTLQAQLLDLRPTAPPGGDGALT